jgi:guanylate kinase
MLGPLIIVSGPAGVGKSTVVARVRSECAAPVRVAVTATTRLPRPGEIDGVNYHFWTREQFEAEVAAGSLLEYAKVHGDCYYGTPRAEVEPYRRQGVGVILVIDVQGAAQVRRLCPEAFSIFLHAPEGEYLKRLQLRGEAPASIEKRLLTMAGEVARAGEYDVQLVNDDLNETVRETCRLIEAQFHRGGT